MRRRRGKRGWGVFRVFVGSERVSAGQGLNPSLWWDS